MKRAGNSSGILCYPAFSALGRAVWDETPGLRGRHHGRISLSVLSVEPYGMKPLAALVARSTHHTFSALGRAVWDETCAAVAF